MKLSNDLIVLDLETTGTWVERDKIIEIAMIKCAKNGETVTYHKRVNPGIAIPPAVIELTGIKNEDLNEAPFFKYIVIEVLDFIGNSDMAGFNVERFDLPLLAREVKDAGHNFDWKRLKVYDAQKVFHINEKRDLSAAYQYYCSKTMENAHCAVDDAQATLEILIEQTKKYGDESLESLEQFKYRENNEYYDDDRKLRWWNGNLYMMFGKYAKKYSLQEVAQKDPKYLEWIISSGFSNEVKALVEDALNGRFPTQNID